MISTSTINSKIKNKFSWWCRRLFRIPYGVMIPFYNETFFEQGGIMHDFRPEIIQWLIENKLNWDYFILALGDGMMPTSGYGVISVYYEEELSLLALRWGLRYT